MNLFLKSVSEIRDPKKIAQEKRSMDLIRLCRKFNTVQIQWKSIDYVAPWRTNPNLPRVSKVSNILLVPFFGQRQLNGGQNFN